MEVIGGWSPDVGGAKAKQVLNNAAGNLNFKRGGKGDDRG